MATVACAELRGTDSDALVGPPPLISGAEIAWITEIEAGPELGAAVRGSCAPWSGAR